MTGQASSPAMPRRWLAILGLAALIGILAYLGTSFTRDQSRVAAVWLPNAVLVAVMLRRPRIDPWLLAAAFLANVLANLASGDIALRALGFSALNSVEILIIDLGMRRRGLDRPDMVDFRVLLTFCCIGGGVAPLVSGALAAALISDGLPLDGHLWLTWSLTDSLGMLLVAPSIWVARDAWRSRAMPSRERLTEWAAILAGGVIVVSLIFCQTRFPLLFLATPFVLLAAFRLGGLGAAAATIIVAAIASVATSMGFGPMMLVRGDMVDRLHVLQAFLAINFCMSLPVAAALARRAAFSRSLQASEDLNRSILDNMREIIFKTDAEGRWVFLNPAWEVLTGYRVDESLGWRTTRLLHPEDLAGAAAIYPDLIAGTIQDCTLRQRFYRKSGELAHIEVSVKRLSDAGGGFSGTIGNIRDITEVVRQQHALADSESRFRRMADAAPIGIFCADAQGSVTYVNQEWSAKTGLTTEQSLGRGWMAAIVDLDDFANSSPWTGFRKPGDVRRRVTHFRDAQGGDLWCETVSSAEFDDEGRIVGFIGVNIDITERLRVERELVERDAQLSLLAQNATDAVFRLTLDGRCLYASPSATELLGIEPRDLVGLNMLARFHPDDEANVRHVFDSLASGRVDRRIVAYRSQLVRQPGVYRWLEANCGLVRDERTRQPCEIIASIRDVSETKAMEEELRLARARAEQAATAKSSFLANMSHEIRTPMNGVIGFTELLSATALDEDQSRHVELIADSGRTMMRLLNDILDISKIEAGQMQLAQEPVDVRHKIGTVARMMESAAAAKGIGLTFGIADNVPRAIIGDQLRLRQVLLNLTGNAVKFTQRGQVSLAATVVDGPAGQALRIDVSDTGIGIAADRLAAVFEIFSQADTSTARRFGGTGLGLAITRQLVGLMGGGISVRSEIGRGTVFSVQLPIRATAQAADLTADTPSPMRAHARPADRRRPRILVAEDHDINQMLMLALGKQLNVDMAIAADGEQAIAMVLEAARSGAIYDLVFMDMQMPVIDGLEVARRLRAAGFSPEQLPIVAVTANAYAEDVVACLDAGMQAHVSKPVRARDISRFIAQYADTAVSFGAIRPRDETAVEMSGVTASLMDRYLLRKKQTLDLMASLAADGGSLDSQYEQMIDMLHKLAGTAGLFGEVALGDTAYDIETALAAAMPDRRAEVVRDGWRQLSKAA